MGVGEIDESEDENNEGQFNTDPRRLWDFLERIGAVTRPPDREWERENNEVLIDADDAD